ncbi:hypothetical protein FXF51_02005 [Nonomuraea sp. PA05]|uniref:hypothetical protein n=1 Tax=Nonomuraea sp. PA05 TaxID=2604466 RepID=UPI0011D6BCD7|nr:hypothetical protein [Nonomuraea sp. PA05]TYB71234.1 hypothetical protein FXF51_02005 [Nonomuraea sp. PA05]
MLRRNSFNGGTAGTSVTVANSGGTSGDAFQVTNGSPTYVAATGTRAPLAASLNDPDTVQWRNIVTAGRELWIRTYVMFASLPSAEDWWFELNQQATSTAVARLTVGPTGTIAIRRDINNPILCSIPAAVTAGQWARIEARVLVGTTTTNGQVNLWVYQTPEAATTTLQASATGVNVGTTLIDEAAVVYLPGYTLTADDFAVSDQGKLGAAFPSNPAIVVQAAATTEQAQAVGRLKQRTLGHPASQETAASIRPIRRRTLGQAAEAATALPVTASKIHTLQTAHETNTAHLVAGAHRRLVGPAAEGDQAQPITNGTFLSVATEANLALPITPRKTRTLGTALDASTATTVRPARARTVGQAVESGQAQPVGRRKIRLVAAVVEADQAQPLRRLGREVTGAEGPHRTWGATLTRRSWSADPPRRTWSAARTKEP